MEIIRSEQTIITGRFSDGSDREIKEIVTYTVKSSNWSMTFDHEPSEAEINDRIAKNDYETIDNTKQQLEDQNCAIAELTLLISQLITPQS